jgi:type IV pilus assembly protein PilE
MNKSTFKAHGFTLVELMVVIAIIGIISAIAFPSYDTYMKKSRRADAKVALSTMADRQERYYLQNNTYSAAVNDVGGSATKEGYYTLAIDSADINSFQLTATAVPGGQQAKDTDCLLMYLSSTGAKESGTTPGGGDPKNCW